MPQRRVGTQEELNAAREELLAEEKELTRRGEVRDPALEFWAADFEGFDKALHGELEPGEGELRADASSR